MADSPDPPPARLVLISRVIMDLRVRQQPDPHCHAVHELLMVERGEYRSRIAGDEVVVQPGQILALPAGTTHRWAMDLDGSVQMLVLQWDGPCPFAAGAVLDDPGRRVQGVGQWLLDLHPPAGAAEENIQQHLLGAVLGELQRSGQLASARDEAMARVRDFLLTNLALPHRREDLARLAGLSPSQLNVRFVEATGLPPMVWLRQQRAQRAATLLANHHRSAAAVAEACGLGSASYLARVLRQTFGTSIRALRRAGR